MYLGQGHLNEAGYNKTSEPTTEHMSISPTANLQFVQPSEAIITLTSDASIL